MSNTYRWASRRDVKVESSLKSSNITLQENTVGKLLKRNGCERLLFQDELAAWTRSLYKLLGFSLSRVSCCVVSCPVLGWLINSITWADVRQPWSCLSSEPFGGMAAAKHSSFADDSRTIVFSSGSRGRVVKAMDLKSIGVSPRRFESYRLRALLGRRTFIL